MKTYCTLIITVIIQLTLFSQTISSGDDIIPLQDEHTHGASIVELPNGDLLSTWFQGNGERWSDDVRIMGSRKLKGQSQWSETFLMADVPDFPDVNPVLFIDAKEQLWLVWYTVIANQWETSLLKYRTSTNYMQQEGPPEWGWQDNIHVRPGGSTERGIQPDDAFVLSVERQYDKLTKDLLNSNPSTKDLESWIQFKTGIINKVKGENLSARGRIFNEDGTFTEAQLGYPISRRIGWQTKNKPAQIGNRILLPLYSDGIEMSLFAITDDFGKTWDFSTPIVGIANIQASIAKKKNGHLVAYMRDNGPPPMRHPMSTSKDGGFTWSDVVDSNIPNPGSGSDVVTLDNGNWVIAYNDTEDGRNSLAVSLSEDEGKSWRSTRHIILDKSDTPMTGAYPSIIAGADGTTIHVIFSFTKYVESQKLENVRHISITEEWIKDGDQNIISNFKAGAAVRKITPDPLIPVSGGMGPSRPVNEQAGDLYARAMVFEKDNERVAIVNIDNLGWPSALGDKSRALIPGVKAENILIGATHTHSGPDAYAFPDETGKTTADMEYLDWCVRQIAEAVNEAVEKLEPAFLKIGEDEAIGKIAFNYYAEDLYDPRCDVIQAVSADKSKNNAVIATLVNYAIHPEVIGSKEGLLSPDLCGPLYDRIESKIGGIALFMNGAQGGMVTADNRIEPDSDIRNYEECVRIGHLLADEALRIIDNAPLQKNPELYSKSESVDFPVDSEMIRFVLENSSLSTELNKDNTISTQLNLLNIGSAQILTIPGEALPNIGYYLKRNMNGQQNMLFGLTNDAFGYILTKEDYNSFKKYNYVTRTSLGEKTADILIKESLKLIKSSPAPIPVKK